MKKKLFLLSFILVVFFSIPTNIFAMTPTFDNDAKFNRGVSNVCYYVDNSVVGYTNYINDALYNWVDTGYGWNPIYVTPVSSNYATHMDFYGVHEHSGDTIIGYGVLGYVSYFDINSVPIIEPPNEPTRDYFYTEIKFNLDDVYMPNIVFRHEIGHAFGLRHSNTQYSIMYYNVDDMKVTTVQKEDHDTINYLYN